MSVPVLLRLRQIADLHAECGGCNTTKTGSDAHPTDHDQELEIWQHWLARYATRVARWQQARLTGVACTVGVPGVPRVAGAGGVVAAGGAVGVGAAALEAASVLTLWWSTGLGFGLLSNLGLRYFRLPNLYPKRNYSAKIRYNMYILGTVN